MGGSAELFPKVFRPPAEWNPSQLIPSGRDHPEPPRDLGKTGTRKPIIRGNECLRTGEAGVHQQSSPLVQSVGDFVGGQVVEFEKLVMKTVLDDVEPRIF